MFAPLAQGMTPFLAAGVSRHTSEQGGQGGEALLHTSCWDAAQNPALLSALPFKPRLPKGTGIISLGKRMERSRKSSDACGWPSNSSGWL